jgi:cell division protein FtsQ
MENRKKYSFKKIIRLIAWIGVVAVFAIASFYAMDKKNNVRAKDIQLVFTDKKGNYFINEKDMMKEVDMVNAHWKGKRIIDLKINALEESIKRNDYVQNAQIVSGQNGKLTIFVEQKNPIARIFEGEGQSYYLSENWDKMPTSGKFSKRVIAIMGATQGLLNPVSKTDSFIQYEVKTILNFVKENDFWAKAIDQVYVEPNGKIELVMVFSHAILKFGTINEDYEKRFNKILIFYKSVLNYVDLSQYKYLDFTYKNQIIGIKS